MPRSLDPVPEGFALWQRAAGPLGFAFVFSGFVNLLQFTAPLYMLQIYDRVLASGSQPTLVALSLIMVFLFLCMGVIDHLRGRVLARIGLQWQARLQEPVMRRALHRLALNAGDVAAHRALADLEALAWLWASPALIAALDLPFTPLFLVALFLLHPLLGTFALLSLAALLGLTLAHHHLGSSLARRAEIAQAIALRCAEDLRAKAEPLQALGLGAAAAGHWLRLLRPAQSLALDQADRSAAYANAGKTLRLFLQSAVLGLGAFLVLGGELAASTMIAGSILLGRALAPIEIAIGQWGGLAQARQAAKRLGEVLAEPLAPEPQTAPPRPAAKLEVQDLRLRAPFGQRDIVQGISFELRGGEVLGIVGPNGSGKSSLLRALTGQFPLAGGKIRLGESEIGHHAPALLARYIGYLPQEVTLFGVSLAQNIAALDPHPPPEALFKAARAAKAHEMILRMEGGYDSRDLSLSGGQLQRIALARALYGEPILLLLDEGDANLDHEGAQAFVAAIRAAKARGAIVALTAHRPNLLGECDQILMLHEGRMLALGPREQILRAAQPPPQGTAPQEGAA